MVDRGLLYKEWKQHQILYLIIFCFLLFIHPFSILNDYRVYLNDLNHYPHEGRFIIDYAPSQYAITWQIGLCILLTVVQIGVERSKGLLDFTLSLPYSRSQVFNTKFLLGVIVLIVSQLLGYLLSELLIVILKPESVLFFHHYMIGSMVISFMAYALVMAAGAMTGHIIAQLLTAFSVAIMPFLIIGLPVLNLSVWMERPAFEQSFPIFDSSLKYLIPIVYIEGHWVSESPFILLIPAVLSILFYLFGYFSFLKHQNERNGSFFLFKQLDRPVQIAVIIFGILGFGSFGYESGDSLTGYVVGMIIGAVVGFLISYFSIYKKIKY
ncbi:ABC transporter permease [Bacillus sp. WMMC1349]|uniref:ABC transporter permease subunit n=1 Tax=Bacillus sp. WMMC1349 TaxID=2736254 RepID=UPI001557F4F2|nr:ABC transporter permease subunit [Bacillus sp. WMMC1349]NPC93808.1 ABC transporter permease [Bacillus sp. WMMC1349]